MNLPRRFRDGINVEQPVLATLADGFGAAATQTLAIDTTVNHGRDGPYALLELAWRATGDQGVQALRREAPA